MDRATDLDRRALLRLLGGCLGGVAFPLPSAARPGPGDPGNRSLLAHDVNAARIGRRFLNEHREEADRDRLLRVLGLPPGGVGNLSPVELEAHGRRLRELHREDFRTASVVELGGWTLSLTELRLAALVWLGRRRRGKAGP